MGVEFRKPQHSQTQDAVSHTAVYLSLAFWGICG